jgi:hypothetical protein
MIMDKNLALVVVASALLFTGVYQNCSKVDFKEPVIDGKVTNLGDPVDDILVSCNNAATSGKMVNASQNLDLPDSKIESGRSVVCEFGKDQNLSELEGTLRARYEQKRSLTLPANAVICDVKMTATSTTGGAAGKIKYDDVFFITYNDYILASNLRYAVKKISPENVKLNSGPTVAFYKYDWLKVRDVHFDGKDPAGGVNINSVEDDYCLGEDEGVPGQICQWPLSEQSGQFKLELAPEQLIRLQSVAPVTSQSISLVVTGDNDPSVDCYHGPLSMKVDVSYYLK